MDVIREWREEDAGAWWKHRNRLTAGVLCGCLIVTLLDWGQWKVNQEGRETSHGL
jgi:hypothetical protein